MSKIVIIQGHPDPAGNRLCHALGHAYAEGARDAGHDVEFIEIGKLDFPLLRSPVDWNAGAEATPPVLIPAQKACLDANHLVFIYPLWLGTMPALLKGFLEQVFRPGVALSQGDGFPKAMLRDKSARIVVTMGMPALAYRFFFMAHSLKNLQRNILGFVGIKPIRNTLFGMVEGVSDKKRSTWLEQMRSLGRQAR
ncbi:NAD(P)H-dependent oxidoreductase [Hoeflea prorocentri]|uniref:NAD(P)H-dependent oxidoreductase n=1 Tax=Hoeflea prorocentri TaxID=1922333 RepID=A0A9X3UIJ0_9HYPH|nr:NAD(P)H-dependent oxidoreductase [Hoeflea prorocentri]MCY6381065.1 NAD(P)H-dependent oxidoreductase [Hoeflea prorocentri]MDA5398865.1 NAD(P)H-dependent oxidoreductase [Hoeflea prorocentri]